MRDVPVHSGAQFVFLPDHDPIDAVNALEKVLVRSRALFIDALLRAMWAHLLDPSLAPQGTHVLSAYVQFAPYNLRDGSWDTQRDALRDAVIRTLSRVKPHLRMAVLELAASKAGVQIELRLTR